MGHDIGYFKVGIGWFFISKGAKGNGEKAGKCVGKGKLDQP